MDRHVQLVTHAPRRQFQRITFGNVFHITCGVVCHLLLGAVNMLVIEYTIKSGDLHALLCTQAWHMYTVEAMFALVFTNAWGSYTNLLLRRVRLIHMVFQIISLLNLLTGTVMIFIATKKRGYYVHGQVGIITLVMFLLTVVVGPTSMISQNNQNIKFFHIGFAVPTFILTSIVMALGFYKNRYKKIINLKLIYVQTAFVGIYTTYITIAIFVNGIYRAIENKYNF